MDEAYPLTQVELIIFSFLGKRRKSTGPIQHIERRCITHLALYFFWKLGATTLPLMPVHLMSDPWVDIIIFYTCIQGGGFILIFHRFNVFP